MRRPKHPLPLSIKHLTKNHATQLYDITENGITYSMSLELTRQLKEYFKAFMPEGNQKFPTVASWYKDLGALRRKNIITSGTSPRQSDEFYPDQHWDDI